MIENMDEVTPGRRFSYGFFTNVEVTGITEDELHFVDSQCNSRILKLKDFRKSAKLLPVLPAKETPAPKAAAAEKPAKKEAKKQEEKPAKQPKKVAEKPAKKEAKAEKKPAKEQKETPAGLIGVMAAEKIYNISSTALYTKIAKGDIEFTKEGKKTLLSTHLLEKTFGLRG